ncbi:hypothetical protein [Streptococcus mitis]|jgi:hypothetical protein|uniref:Uncharacterized protein n=1 Tax=Streptococcus mitis TaxID=28037 RepID=A0A6I1TZC8_STRMT|nr:hypothetical protein [Streptococcus mitis]MQQ30738.1 hypothetical protein [Streptococcus mitis]
MTTKEQLLKEVEELKVSIFADCSQTSWRYHVQKTWTKKETEKALEEIGQGATAIDLAPDGLKEIWRNDFTDKKYSRDYWVIKNYTSDQLEEYVLLLKELQSRVLPYFDK